MLLKEILYKNKENNKIAIIQGSDTISYSQLFDMVIEKTRILKSFIQIDASSNIGIFLPNSIQYIISFFSITFLNGIIVPLSIKSKVYEIQNTIKSCDLKLIITDNKNIRYLDKILSKHNFNIIVFDIINEEFKIYGNNMSLTNFISTSNNSSDSSSVALLLQSSGTTSNPKRVMLSHNNIISNIKSIINSINLTKDDTTLIVLPMHLSSANSQFITHLYLGASIVIMDTLFFPNKFLYFIQKRQITNSICVPVMMLTLLTNEEHVFHDISTLKTIGICGSSIPAEKLKKLILKFSNVNFVIMYGQTEASPRISHLLANTSLQKLCSVGKPLDGISLRIVDKNGADVMPHAIGEIIVNGNSVMKGYYKNENETCKVIKDNWLYTGDLAKYDDDGFIYIVGRKKNLVISGGLNIYPEEVEEVLMTHPLIKDAYVYGKQHELLGEIPIANVVKNDIDTSLNEKQLISFCLDKIESYKIPRIIKFVKKITKTASGKTKRIY